MLVDLSNTSEYHFLFSLIVQAYLTVPRLQWVVSWPGQVVLCVSQIYWTAEVHEAIRSGPQGVKEYHQKLNSQVGTPATV